MKFELHVKKVDNGYTVTFFDWQAKADTFQAITVHTDLAGVRAMVQARSMRILNALSADYDNELEVINGDA